MSEPQSEDQAPPAEEADDDSPQEKKKHRGPLPLSSDPDTGFMNRLAKTVERIKDAAKGRVCSECKHVRDGWCATQRNYNGDNLAVLYPTAVACRNFEAA